MKSLRPHKTEIRADERLDQFMEGRLKLIQSRDGYRFSIDAILLSQFVTVRPGDVVVDLGTGCGVMLLILLLTRKVGHAIGLEIQKELASQAARNALLNGFQDTMNIILGDIRRPPLAKESADVIICNPPYRKVKSGRINPDPRRAIARHEILSSVDDILRATTNTLRKKGRLAMIYPTVRLVDILARLRRYNLEPKRIQINYPDLESAAKLALIESVLGGKPGVEICPPLLGQGNFGVSP
jgi:tRNA1Val (adenine37-N6)-methyltransferase